MDTLNKETLDRIYGPVEVDGVKTMILEDMPDKTKQKLEELVKHLMGIFYDSGRGDVLGDEAYFGRGVYYAVNKIKDLIEENKSDETKWI